MAVAKWLPEAQKDMEKIDNSIRIRIFKAIRKLEKDPVGYGTPLGHHAGKNLTNFYKIEPADGYRIVYTIIKDELVIISVVGQRTDKRVYRTATERIAAVRALVNKEIEKITKLVDDQ
ncbi:MAG: type II toxin-antitoxin system RelE family toxin [Syntrophomonadaceae bacterium]|jgi:mRNA interferase RelE/StbE